MIGVLGSCKYVLMCLAPQAVVDEPAARSINYGNVFQDHQVFIAIMMHTCDCGLSISLFDSDGSRRDACPICGTTISLKSTKPAEPEPPAAQSTGPKSRMHVCQCGLSINTHESDNTPLDQCPICGAKISHQSIEESNTESAIPETLASGPKTLKDLYTESTGIDIDLSKLTIAGWCLALFSILLTTALLTFGFLIYAIATNSENPGPYKGIVMAVGVPLAIIIGGIVFYMGKLLFSAIGIAISKPDR